MGLTTVQRYCAACDDFTPDKVTSNSTFVLRMLAEGAVEMQKDVYVFH